MKFVVDVDRATAAPVTYRDNNHVLEMWAERNKPPVLGEENYRNLFYEINRFIQAFPEINVWELQPRHINAYLEMVYGMCANLRRPPRPRGEVDGPPTADYDCSLKLDTDDCAVCPMFAQRKSDTMQKTATAIKRLYKMMARDGVIATNWVRDVVADYMADIARSSRKVKQRTPTHEEVIAMIQGARYISSKFPIFLMAKVGVRSVEAVKLRVDSKHYNRDMGYFLVPDYPHMKRRGRKEVWIDDQLALWLDQYLPWREQVMAANGETHNRLLVTRTGKHYDVKRRRHELTSSIIHPLARRLGLFDDETMMQDRIGAHSLRHYFSTQLHERGCFGRWWQLLRGDEMGGNEEAYIDADPRKRRDAYLKWAPRIDVHPPGLQFDATDMVHSHLENLGDLKMRLQEREAAKVERLYERAADWIRANSGNRVNKTKEAELLILKWASEMDGMWFRRADMPELSDRNAANNAMRNLVAKGAFATKGRQMGMRYLVDLGRVVQLLSVFEDYAGVNGWRAECRAESLLSKAA